MQTWPDGLLVTFALKDGLHLGNRTAVKQGYSFLLLDVYSARIKISINAQPYILCFVFRHGYLALYWILIWINQIKLGAVAGKIKKWR